MNKPYADCITCSDNEITLRSLDHPQRVSKFIRCLRQILQQGYNLVHIKDLTTITFPNACVPIAGIIDLYRKQGIEFTFDVPTDSYLNKCCFVHPYFCNDTDNLDAAYAYPFDKIFKFNSGLQVAKLSQAFVDILSKLAPCEKGVLDSLNWCINEVMDNVLTHSQSGEGYIMAQLHPKTNHIAVCVSDTGIGIYNTLKNSPHIPQSETDALTMAIQEGVGDGLGQGNGLYGLFASIQLNRGRLSLTSGKSSIMVTETGEIKKFENLPFVSSDNKGTIVDFQLFLNRGFDFPSIFQTIGGYEAFDIRIDNMLSETDEYIHYNVYANSKGTGTREAGRKLRNDILNTMRRESRIMVLDFTHVQTVSSSFIDEFMAKLVLDLGFAKFNEAVRVTGMNERVTFLFERSLYMRISAEWNKQTAHAQAQQ